MSEQRQEDTIEKILKALEEQESRKPDDDSEQVRRPVTIGNFGKELFHFATFSSTRDKKNVEVIKDVYRHSRQDDYYYSRVQRAVWLALKESKLVGATIISLLVFIAAFSSGLMLLFHYTRATNFLITKIIYIIIGIILIFTARACIGIGITNICIAMRDAHDAVIRRQKTLQKQEQLAEEKAAKAAAAAESAEQGENNNNAPKRAPKARPWQNPPPGSRSNDQPGET